MRLDLEPLTTPDLAADPGWTGHRQDGDPAAGPRLSQHLEVACHRVGPAVMGAHLYALGRWSAVHRRRVGVVMASVFCGFIFTGDPIVKSIAFALTVGVLLDAFVVRLTVILAVMALLGR